MEPTEQITVGETTAGKGATGPSGRTVALPVDEVLSGRGFVTGIADSGKTTTAGLIAERLLERGYGLVVVDPDGDYVDLKSSFAAVHCGADAGCDVRVTPAHGERLAALAVERRVPILLDLSGFDDVETADAVVASVAKHLDATATDRTRPTVLLVEDVHEYVSDGPGMSDAGRILRSIATRDRTAGLGLCGVAPHPADVAPAFVDRCDWHVFHRLTWNNDTKVVRRLLGGEYARAVGDLDTGEAFLATDWSNRITRMAVDEPRSGRRGDGDDRRGKRRSSFVPVGDDVLAEIRGVRSTENEHEDRVADLRAELEENAARIEALEAELEDARDLQDVARQFVDALTEHVEAAAREQTDRARREGTYREGRGRTHRERRNQPSGGRAESLVGADTTADPGTDAGATRNGDEAASGSDTEDAFAAFGELMGGDDADASTTDSGDDGFAALAGIGDDSGTGRTADDGLDRAASRRSDTRRAVSDGGLSVRSFSTELAEFEGGAAAIDDVPVGTASGDGRPAVVAALEATLSELDKPALELLSLYRAEGPEMPADAYHAVTGRQDRVEAYGLNRRLRTAGLIEHVGRGHYDYCLRERIEAGLPEDRDEGMASVYARDLEQQFLD